MPDSTTPAAPKWPKLLTIADYARACSVEVGKEVTRQAISQRLLAGTLTAQTVTVGGKGRRYIDTEAYPPGPGPGRWANRPAGSVPRPKRPKS